jgi:hypothetical protein
MVTHRYPTLKAVIKPILPAVASFYSVPFASMIAFFGIYLGVVNNRNLSRFVRFNAMQVLRGLGCLYWSTMHFAVRVCTQ